MSARLLPASRRLAAGALLLLAACAGSSVDGTVGPRSPGTGGAGGSGAEGSQGGTLAERLVGRWDRVIYFYDAYGDLNASETVWTFAADGSAARTVYARNVTWGYADAVVGLARWRLVGSEVEVTWQPPDAGTARFQAALRRGTLGDVLTLGADAYDRVTP